MFVIKKKTLITVAIGLSVVIAFSVLIGSLSVTGARDSSVTGITVVLDAGHGGIDGGVTGVNTGVKESDLNLAVVKKLEKCLKDGGMNVILTRKSSGGLYGVAMGGFKKRDMKKRKEIIVENKPDVVLSVHMNKCPYPSRRGGQVFYRKDSENGKLLAQSVQESLNGLEESTRDFSPLTGDYFILNCSETPSVIIECGFLSNAEDEKLLTDEEYQDKLAYSIFKGLVGYLSDTGAFMSEA